MDILEAKHIKDYTIEVRFENGETRTVDFEKFLNTAKQQMTRQYLDKERFKNEIKIRNGQLQWGDWQMDISSESIYQGQFD